MSRRKSNLIKLSFALAAMVLAFSGSFNHTTRAARQDLPEGKGVELARDKCVNCHEADLIVSQRLSRQGWVREVEKMIRWGAVVSDSEKEILVDYFAANFKPRSAAPAQTATGADRGKQIFEEKCLLCHEADLSEQQRLSRQGWTREVEKMVRWGAVVTDAEKESLVDYLFKNFGPRPLNNRK
ncbi:MAG: c-type cytochrome [Blastocatellia bacterium]